MATSSSMVVPSEGKPSKGTGRTVSGSGSDGHGERHSCVSRALNPPGMVQWGNRRRVRFLSRHEEEPEVPDLEAQTVQQDQKGDDEEEEQVVEAVKCTRSSGKRKLNHGESSTRRTSISTSSSRAQKLVKRSKQLKNSIHRWSAYRYKSAEQNMLNIMIAKGAVPGNPVLRASLRAEARKLIGDTGLLDHLLKHMAGNVAPGGKYRFRRRHNSDGALEYWIECANLFEIRRMAGVTDSYWIPPPGWRPGDDPTQDPVSARELKEIKTEMAKIKRCIQELGSKKLEEEPSSSSTRELRSLLLGCKNPEEDLNRNPTITNVDMAEYEGYFLLMKKALVELEKEKAKIDKQLMEMSEYLNIMEEQLLIWKSRGLLSDSEIWERSKESGEKGKSSDEGGDKEPAASATQTMETRAAKIQRLRSGFRICKPQGSFLWPNMQVTNSQSDYPHVVQTPPSASSSTLSPAPYLFYLPQTPHPPCPLKPVPFRFPPLSSTPQGSPSLDTPLPKTPSTPLINLNESPKDATEF
ncbi:Protein DYAD [Parasponia andersonii]|uniref:Protein DYAD n=1 Tax=Parasponia andersonii TaxID=3476 RepID=A0A2P5BQL6_PARAD|nr:Protein DYAD [Parasponia andersonii]